MRLYGLSADNGGCGFYRVQLPLAMLAANGHQVRGMTQPPGRIPFPRLLLRSQPVDLCVGQRIVSPHLLPLWHRIGQHARLVLDLDDDLFHIPPDNARAYAIYIKRDVQANLREAIRAADLVTVSTEPLVRAVVDECGVDPARIVVLPNQAAPSMLAVDRPRRDRVTVGWAGGTSHEPDIALVAPHLHRFLAEHPAVDLHVIGHDWRELRGPTTRVTPWSRSIPDYWQSIDFDIALAPLAHSIFAMGKSALKVIEYGALGIPCLASDEAPYRDTVVDGVTGFLIRRPTDWDARLRELVNDAAMREQMGAAAKAHISEHHNMADGWRAWERAYQAIAGPQTATAARTAPAVTTRHVLQKVG